MSVFKRPGPDSVLPRALARCSARPSLSGRHPRGSFGQIPDFERCMKIWNGDLHEKKRSTALSVEHTGPGPRAFYNALTSAPASWVARITVISNLNDVLYWLLVIYRLKYFCCFQNLGQRCYHSPECKKFKTKTAFGLISRCLPGHLENKRG